MVGGVRLMLYDQTVAISRRHQRLVWLVRSGGFSTPTLAKELGVSDQTVYRDILHLKRSGYVIRPQRRGGGWAYVLVSEPPAPKAEEEGTSP
jgi:DeoR/GlpR family transcriptional regulator of sugar metabolism